MRPSVRVQLEGNIVIKTPIYTNCIVADTRVKKRPPDNAHALGIIIMAGRFFSRHERLLDNFIVHLK